MRAGLILAATLALAACAETAEQAAAATGLPAEVVPASRTYRFCVNTRLELHNVETQSPARQIGDAIEYCAAEQRATHQEIDRATSDPEERVRLRRVLDDLVREEGRETVAYAGRHYGR